MIFELRAYDLIPGKAPDYIDLFRKDGVQYVTRHLPMGGYWLTDSGMLNRLYHLWIYESLEERMECRAGLATDADWLACPGHEHLRLSESTSTLTQKSARWIIRGCS